MTARLHGCRVGDSVWSVRFGPCCCDEAMCVPALPAWLPSAFYGIFLLAPAQHGKQAQGKRTPHAAIGDRAAPLASRDDFPGPGRHVWSQGGFSSLFCSSTLRPLPLRYCGPVMEEGGGKTGSGMFLGLSFPTPDITTSGQVCGVIYSALFSFARANGGGWVVVHGCGRGLDRRLSVGRGICCCG